MIEKFYKNLNNQEDPTNNQPRIDINKKELLGEGTYAPVFKVDLKTGDHVKDFALKDYTNVNKENEKHNYNCAVEAFLNYQKAKKAGLKVFPTVRINEEKNKLLVTLGTNNEYQIVSKDSTSNWKKVKDIKNIENLISDMENNFLNATRSKINLSWDSIFFVFKKTNPECVDFVIGDYDGLLSFKKDKNFEYMFKINCEQLEYVLGFLLDIYLEDSSLEKYKGIVKKRLNQFIDKYNQEFLGLINKT